jgi:DNA-directed RNA polymerase subunit RPC12/RpoP
MDVIFNCSHCQQELEVDSSGAGTEIECPSCGETILIPAADSARAKPVPASAPVPAPALPPKPGGSHTLNPIASSAAAKEEKHFSVPVRDVPTEQLIEKPLPPLEVAALESDKKVRVKTIRHTDCIEVGHDRFDEVVTNFLGKVGETNIVSINTLTYTHLDVGSQKLITDYAVLIVYKG